MNIVFFGSSKLVLPIIKILQKNFNLKLVITTEQKETDAVPAFCLKEYISYISVKELDNKIVAQLKPLKTPVAVLADFGLIIPDDILNAFPKGIINVHPSLLPLYRGPTPVQSAMVAGEKETGISIIKLDSELDHGPLLTQEKEPILDTDTGESLHTRLFEKSATMLLDILPKYMTEELTLTPQDHTKATYTEKLTRESGYIDPSDLKIDNWKLKIERMVRAYYPWPGVWTHIRLKMKDERLKIIKFLPSQSHPELDSGSYPFLLQVEGKKPMSYKDFTNGYPNVILPILEELKIKD